MNSTSYFQIPDLDNSLVLTPNKRIANFLVNNITTNGCYKDKSAYPSPNIYSLHIWLQRLWQDINFWLPEYTVLSDFQATCLFYNIINDISGNSLIRMYATAKIAYSAWTTSVNYALELDEIIQSNTCSSDCSTFVAWAKQYIKLCAKNNWLDNATLLQKIISFISTGKVKISRCVYWVEFIELNPLLHRLRNVLSDIGVENHDITLTQTNTKKMFLTSFPDMESTAKAAAMWAKNAYLENKNLRIGVIIPDLNLNRNLVSRIFRICLPSDSYNISAPVAIAKTPMVSTFLLFLTNSEARNLDINTISKMLRAVHIGNIDADRCARSVADIKIKNLAEENISKTKIINILENIIIDGALDDFNSRFNLWLEKSKLLRGKNTLQHWFNVVVELINIWCKPKENFTTIEQQIFICWELLLNEWLDNSKITQKVSFTTAINLLCRLAGETPFAAETGTPPIQVLGLLEAVGLPFDMLMISNMQNTTWPTEAKPNPFIPLTLQQQYAIPRSSATREFQFCEKVTSILFRMAKNEAVFSYIKDESRMTSASKLLPVMENITISTEDEQLRSSTGVEFEYEDDIYATKIDTNYAASSNLLAMQANCPFSAFAIYRLGASQIKLPAIGLNSINRGELAHAILAKFWQCTKSLSSLLRLTQQQLESRLYVICEQEIERHPVAKLLAVEHKLSEVSRLIKLITLWLEQERKREDFSVIATETKSKIDFANLTLNLRIDRIDRTIDSKILIIDYKTGNIGTDWYESRFVSVQMPLYALAVENTNTIALAKVHIEKNYFVGIGENKALNGIEVVEQPEWSKQLSRWQKTLAEIAQEFIEGVAKVEPLYSSSCDYCHLSLACRIKHK